MLACHFLSFHKNKKEHQQTFKSNWFCLFIHGRSGVHTDLLCYLFSHQNLENNFNKKFLIPRVAVTIYNTLGSIAVHT